MPADPELIWVDLDQLAPNPWNPNVMDDEMFGKAVESIHRFGFVDPITVRGAFGRFEIIDGEHRWKAAKVHSGGCRREKGKYVEHVGMEQVPIINLGPLDDAIAQQLTIVLNETRGVPEPKKLGELLVTLLISEPLPKLAELLPLDEDRIIELAELPKVNWDDPTPKVTGSPRSEKWVERVFRLPLAIAERFDEAIEHAKEYGGAPGATEAEAIRRIAEDYLNQ